MRRRDQDNGGRAFPSQNPGASMEPGRRDPAPGRTPGQSQNNYTNTERLVAFQALMRECPDNPSGTKFIETLRKELPSRSFGALQSFISKPMRVFFPGYFASIYKNDLGLISGEQEDFVRTYMKDDLLFINSLKSKTKGPEDNVPSTSSGIGSNSRRYPALRMAFSTPKKKEHFTSKFPHELSPVECENPIVAQLARSIADNLMDKLKGNSSSKVSALLGICNNSMNKVIDLDESDMQLYRNLCKLSKDNESEENDNASDGHDKRIEFDDSFEKRSLDDKDEIHGDANSKQKTQGDVDVIESDDSFQIKTSNDNDDGDRDSERGSEEDVELKESSDVFQMKTSNDNDKDDSDRDSERGGQGDVELIHSDVRNERKSEGLVNLLDNDNRGETESQGQKCRKRGNDGHETGRQIKIRVKEYCDSQESRDEEQLKARISTITIIDIFVKGYKGRDSPFTVSRRDGKLVATHTDEEMQDCSTAGVVSFGSSKTTVKDSILQQDAVSQADKDAPLTPFTISGESQSNVTYTIMHMRLQDKEEFPVLVRTRIGDLFNKNM